MAGAAHVPVVSLYELPIEGETRNKKSKTLEGSKKDSTGKHPGMGWRHGTGMGEINAWVFRMQRELQGFTAVRATHRLRATLGFRRGSIGFRVQRFCGDVAAVVLSRGQVGAGGGNDY